MIPNQQPKETLNQVFLKWKANNVITAYINTTRDLNVPKQRKLNWNTG